MEKQFIFKARPSKIGAIMTEARGATITEKQLAELEGLLAKVKLTEKQAEKRDQLIAKRDAKPELSKTAQTVVEEQLLKDVFGINREFWSKETDKGNECEQDSIDLLKKVGGLFGIEKNEETFENDFLRGTPDVLGDDPVIDVKTPWSGSTFPWFADQLPDKAYEWQLRGYMALTGRKVGYVAYCLTNATEDIIQDEIRRTCWREKIIEPTDEQVDEIETRVRWQMEFDHVPDPLRVKLFKVEHDEKAEQAIRDRVELCREYYNKRLAELSQNMDAAPIIPNV